MTPDTRTLLTEIAPDVGMVVGREYHVIANRQPGYGGASTDSVVVEEIDKHYIVMHLNAVKNFRLEGILAVADVNDPQLALKKMYDSAKKVAEKRARFDRNTVIDLTSRAKKITGSDKSYVPERYCDRLHA